MNKRLISFPNRSILLTLLSVLMIAALAAGCTGLAATGAPAGTQAAPAATAVPPTPTSSPENEAWLKAAQLGAYATEKQDWAAIEAAANKEGKLVVYVPDASYKAAAKVFMEKYPQIQVEIYDILSSNLNQRVREEQKSGVFNADVYINPDFGETINEFLPLGYLRNFVPDSVKDRIPAQYQQPLLTRAISGRVFYYNSELYDKCPISNWWDLTEPAWKGKLVLNDPNTEIYGLAVLAMATLHGDDLAKAYADKYGQPPKMDSDTPNAGYLWLKRIAANEPVVAVGQGPVVAVGTKGMKEAPMANGSYFYYYLAINGQLAVKPCLDLNPVTAILSQNILAMINRAPHPNAAKLFIRFALEDEAGSNSLARVGQYPTVDGMPTPKGNIPLPDMLKVSWVNDLNGIYAILPKVQDFWIKATAR